MQAQGILDWSIPADFSVKFQGLESQLYIGGVYINQYLKNPGYPLRDPRLFLEGLLRTYFSDVADPKQQDRALLLAATTVEVLKFQGRLGEHAVTLGYVERLLKLISSRVSTSGTLQLLSASPLCLD